MWNIKATVPDDNITIVRYSDNVGRDNAYGYFQIPVESLEHVFMQWKKMSSPTHYNGTVTAFCSLTPSLDYFIAH